MAEPRDASIANTSVSDQATAQDSLGFAPYVTAIADFLTNPDTAPPLTLSVEGEWGSGKSSFMKQLQQEIKERKKKQVKAKLIQQEKRIRKVLLDSYFAQPKGLLINRSPRFLRKFVLKFVIYVTRLSLFVLDVILSLFFQILRGLLPFFIRQPRTVWFNAWRHDKAEALWAAFALEFIRQISTIRNPGDFLPKPGDFFPVLWGHLRLFLCRIEVSWRSFFDLIKIAAQLLLGIAAILLIFVFTIGEGTGWVNKFSQQIEQIYIDLQTIVKPKQADKKKSAQPSSQAKTNNSSPQTKSSSTSGQSEPNDLLTYALQALGMGSSGLITVKLAKQLKEMLGDPKKELTDYINCPDYKKQVAFVEKFHQDFKKIVNAYVGKGKVYVFIDDLDRCELPKSAELMQALNLMISEDPSIIFILGMDREKVAAGLAVKYKDLLPYLLSEIKSDEEKSKTKVNAVGGLEYGYAFIEKFVQLPFFVPQPSNRDLDFYLQSIAKPTSVEKTWIIRLLQTIVEIPSMLKEWRQQIRPSFPTSEEKQPNRVVNPAPETGPSPSNSDQSKEQKLERRQRIKLQVKNDGKVIREIIPMVAPALDYNPRRIKQFINLFRLRAFIAADTGLFDEWVNTSSNEAVENPLTLEQLGKFVAINLKWPLLLEDLEADPELFQKLDRVFHPPSTEQYLNEERVKRWLNREKLKELFCYGKEPLANYRLAEVDGERLLQVSPKGGRPKDNIQRFSENLGNNVSLEMVVIPSGKFLMGTSEEEIQDLIKRYGKEKEEFFRRETLQHEVSIESFVMGQFPITQAQWREVAVLPRIKRYLRPEPSSFSGEDLPVENVSWDDAVEFCARLSKLTGKRYRLPSEAEWEYACRAETTTAYAFGEELNKDLANYDDNIGQTTAVGRYPANDFKLFDLHGNVWEWCLDNWHEDYNGAPNDGSAWTDKNDNRLHVLRGGSWFGDPRYCRSAYRSHFGTRVPRLDSIGFRVSCELPRTLLNA